MDDNKRKRVGRDVLMGGAGAYTLDRGMQMATGQERLYHGTSAQNWNTIKEEGLRADRGGIGGASEAVGSSGFVDHSKGRVHVTKKRMVANAFAGYASSKDIPGAEPHTEALKGIFGNHAGKRVKMYMNYGKWDKDFEFDPDCVGDKYFKDCAARGKVNINPDEIVGSSAPLRAKLTRAIKYFPEYAKAYPKRLAGGIGLTAGGAAALGYAARDSYKQLNKEASENFQQRVSNFLSKTTCN